MDFKAGDKVKIIKKDDEENNFWMDEMDSFLGTVQEIFFIRNEKTRWKDYNVFIKHKDGMNQTVNNKVERGWFFPRRCLELIGQKKESCTVTHSLCPRCNSELKEVFSEYCQANIQKCSNNKCNWC